MQSRTSYHKIHVQISTQLYDSNRNNIKPNKNLIGSEITGDGYLQQIKKFNNPVSKCNLWFSHRALYSSEVESTLNEKAMCFFPPAYKDSITSTPSEPVENLSKILVFDCKCLEQ